MARRKAAIFCLASALLAAACASAPEPQLPPPPLPTNPELPPIGIAPPFAPIPQLPAPPPAVAPMAQRIEPAMPSDAVSLRARYGAPDFIRREMDSELWRYDGSNCAAFFFLYREGSALKLRYSETLPRGMSMSADPACLQSLTARAGMS